MGSPDIHQHFFGRNPNKKRDGIRRDNLKSFKGILGVDISAVLHRALRTQTGSAVFDMEPKVPLYDAVSKVMDYVRSLISFREGGAKELILFMDGRSHPMKNMSGREHKRDMALNELNNIYEFGYCTPATTF